MKQSTKVLLFGVIYAVIAQLLYTEAYALGLVYVILSGLSAILYVLLDREEERVRRIYYV